MTLDSICNSCNVFYVYFIGPKVRKQDFWRGDKKFNGRGDDGEGEGGFTCTRQHFIHILAISTEQWWNFGIVSVTFTSELNRWERSGWGPIQAGCFTLHCKTRTDIPSHCSRDQREFSIPGILVRISFIFSRSTMRFHLVILVPFSKHEILKEKILFSSRTLRFIRQKSRLVSNLEI